MFSRLSGSLGRAVLQAIALTAAALLVVAGVVAADGEISVAVADPDDREFPELTLVLTADRAGRPVGQLTPEQVTVTEGGQPAVVTAVRRAQDSGIPLAVVVTLDTSGSMEGASMTAAKAAAGALLQRLGGNDSAAVVAFSDRAQVLQPLTRDRAALQAAVAGLAPGGNTALYDAVGESARLATDSGNLRRAVVLLSDGREFGGSSRLTRDQALERAAQGGAVFYTVGIGPDIDRAFLAEVAARSGGRSFEASGASDVPQIYSALEELLRGQFVVTARSSAPATGSARQIRVEVREGGGQGVVQRQYASRRETPSAPEPLPPTAIVPAAPAETVPAAPPAAGSGLVSLLAAVGGLAALLAIILVALRRRRRAPSPPAAVMMPRRGSVELPQAAGALLGSSGVMLGARFELAKVPATIGTAESCVVRIPTVDGVAPEHARLWWRDGSPMLHHLADGYETRVNGRLIDWASLEVGMEIQFGPVMLTFVAPDGLADAASPHSPVVSAGGGVVDEAAPRALRPGA